MRLPTYYIFFLATLTMALSKLQTNSYQFQALLDKHPGSTLQKLLKVDLYSCLLLSDQLKVNKNYSTDWFYQIMITIFEYYLILLPELEKDLKVVKEDRVENESDWELIIKSHLKRYKAEVMTNSKYSDYYEETIAYLKLRQELRICLQNRVK